MLRELRPGDSLWDTMSPLIKTMMVLAFLMFVFAPMLMIAVDATARWFFR